MLYAPDMIWAVILDILASHPAAVAGAATLLAWLVALALARERNRGC